MYLRILFLTIVVFLFGGCSSYQAWFGETKPQLTFAELNSQSESGETSTSRIFLWSPKNSAALINEEGKGCIQGAPLFHTTGSKVDINDSILNVLSKVNISSDNESQLLALKITNEMISLRNNSERNSYLSIGMFGLCQLLANNKITKSEYKDLVMKLLDNSANLTNPAATNDSLISKKDEQQTTEKTTK